VPNPGFALNCPKCGTRLTYRWSDGDTHIYSCPKHGRVVLPLSGGVRVDDSVLLNGQTARHDA
jgi:hypothetical protein